MLKSIYIVRRFLKNPCFFETVCCLSSFNTNFNTFFLTNKSVPNFQRAFNNPSCYSTYVRCGNSFNFFEPFICFAAALNSSQHIVVVIPVLITYSLSASYTKPTLVDNFDLCQCQQTAQTQTRYTKTPIV